MPSEEQKAFEYARLPAQQFSLRWRDTVSVLVPGPDRRARIVVVPAARVPSRHAAKQPGSRNQRDESQATGLVEAQGSRDDGQRHLQFIWAALGTRAVTLPPFKGPSGLLLGLQLVAGRFPDRRLFDVAEAVMKAHG